MKKLYLKYQKYVNKYLIAFVVFLVWITFLDNNSLVTQYRMFSEYKRLKNITAFYKREIAKNEKEVALFRKGLGYSERIAREKYSMKKENEEIIIFVKHSDKWILQKNM